MTSAFCHHGATTCRAGRSVFFTGCAGTGKSLLLRHVLAALPAGATFATASTGLAACALGGTTLNAFAGVGRAEVSERGTKHTEPTQARGDKHCIGPSVLETMSGGSTSAG